MRLGMFVVLVALGSVAHANCKMAAPIALNEANLLTRGLLLKDAKFDKAPPFTIPDRFNPALDKLDMRLFNIRLENSQRDMLGGSIQVSGKTEVVGFASRYGSDANLGGSTMLFGDSAVYTTRKTDLYSSRGNAKNEALTELKVMVRRGLLTAVQLTVPVFQVVELGDSLRRIVFTGRHETLCLREANF